MHNGHLSAHGPHVVASPVWLFNGISCTKEQRAARKVTMYLFELCWDGVKRSAALSLSEPEPDTSVPELSLGRSMRADWAGCVVNSHTLCCVSRIIHRIWNQVTKVLFDLERNQLLNDFLHFPSQKNPTGKQRVKANNGLVSNSSQYLQLYIYVPVFNFPDIKYIKTFKDRILNWLLSNN